MSLRERLRSMFNRAKEQATDMAQVARMKLDLRELEGRRDHLFREIGRNVYTRHREGRGYPEFERSFADVRTLEASIEKKRAEMRAVRERPGSAEPATEPASTPTGA